jgi:hypothetical protein
MKSLRAGQFVSGSRLVAEAAFRRLTTPRGMLRGGEEEANYGLDLSELIGSVSTKSDAATLAGRIKNELSKDERINRVDVDVVATTEGAATTFEINIGATTSEGPFSLALFVDEVTVEILGITAE